MKTVLEILTLCTQYLQDKGIAFPRREAEYLLSGVLNIERVGVYLQFERPMDDSEIHLCRQRLARRAKGEPLAYIQGSIDFFDCKICVTRDVLIPRQETEILVENISKFFEQRDLEKLHLWDICCGSGCIGIALKKKFPQLNVSFSDVSSAALELARVNAKNNGVEGEFLLGDLLTPFKGKSASFVVCNPPYVPAPLIPSLDKEVRDYEPELALNGGSTGLLFYERLADGLREYMEKRGRVWLEIGHDQGDSVKKLFNRCGYGELSLMKDWSGKDRFFSLEIE